MKKKSLLLVLLSISIVSFAQTQVATLQHGDDISVFYGATAFIEAHDEAENGDIITLSSGTFAVPDWVTKAITLRGAGVVSDSITGQAPTIFASEVKIDMEDDTVPFQMEGILITNKMSYGNLNNPKFTRCSFNKIDTYSNSYWMDNAQFINCIINSFNFDYTYSTTLINSVVWAGKYISNENPVLFYNSIFGITTPNGYSGVSAFNSILIRTGAEPYTENTFINCIGVTNDNYNTFGNGYTINCDNLSFEEVFESFTGDFSLEEPFILKDDIATDWLGNDGTQVGIYGGFMPYSNRPTYMVLKRCNVANKSTIDGKLSVDIEVVTEE